MNIRIFNNKSFWISVLSIRNNLMKLSKFSLYYNILLGIHPVLLELILISTYMPFYRFRSYILANNVKSSIDNLNFSIGFRKPKHL